MHRSVLLAFAIVAAAGLGIGSWFALRANADDRFAECRGTALATGGTQIGGPFTLTSETGETVTSEEVIEGLTLIYFGYTFCPDVCPLDAARNAMAVDLLAEKDIAVKPVFITIDPERDTAGELALFTDQIHPDMLGLTGPEEALRDARKAYLVYAAKSGEDTDYLMDHTSYSYLMHPDHGLTVLFRHDQAAEEIVESAICVAERL